MFRALLLTALIALFSIPGKAQTQNPLDSLRNLLLQEPEPLKRAVLLEALAEAQHNQGRITRAIASLNESNRLRGQSNGKGNRIENLLKIASYYQELDNPSMALAYLRLYSLEMQESQKLIFLNQKLDLERLQNLEIKALEEQRDRLLNESRNYVDQIQSLEKRLNFFQLIATAGLIVFLMGGTMVFFLIMKKKQRAAPVSVENDDLAGKISNLEKEIGNLKSSVVSTDFLVRKLELLDATPANNFEKMFQTLVKFEKSREGSGSNFMWNTAQSETICIAIGQANLSGVKGRLIAILVKKILRKVVQEDEMRTPAMVLSLLDQKLRQLTGNESELPYIGCSLIFCMINPKAREIELAAAGLQAYCIQNNNARCIQGNLLPLANSFAQEKFFETQSLSMNPGDAIYLSTTGYMDQPGHREDKRFGRKAFLKLLESIAGKDPADQHFILDKVFKEWRGLKPQTDDLLVLGMKL